MAIRAANTLWGEEQCRLGETTSPKGRRYRGLHYIVDVLHEWAIAQKLCPQKRKISVRRNVPPDYTAVVHTWS